MKSISESFMNFCKNIIFGAKINDVIYDYDIQKLILNLTVISLLYKILPNISKFSQKVIKTFTFT